MMMTMTTMMIVIVITIVILILIPFLRCSAHRSHPRGCVVPRGRDLPRAHPHPAHRRRRAITDPPAAHSPRRFLGFSVLFSANF
jgi:hypothetical protein